MVVYLISLLILFCLFDCLHMLSRLPDTIVPLASGVPALTGVYHHIWIVNEFINTILTGGALPSSGEPRSKVETPEGPASKVGALCKGWALCHSCDALGSLPSSQGWFTRALRGEAWPGRGQRMG